MGLRRSTFLKFLPLAISRPWASAASGSAAHPFPPLFDPCDFGAVGDGRRPDTKAVQAAIDAAAAAGGGRVHLHNGRFLCGSLHLKSNITLHIERGAVLLGSARIEDYPDEPSSYSSRSSLLYTRRSLIYAHNAENLAIVGGGVIDGQGASAPFRQLERKPEAERPLLLRFSECRDIRLRDITLRDSAMWVQNYLACDNVLIDGISVASRVNRNNDGIDIDDCSNVRIINCDIWSGDDAICLKSTSRRGCRNVVIANCTLSSLSNGLKLGTDSTGGFENIAITNCAVSDTNLAAIALECVDGGTLERVVISNIAMARVGCAIFLRLGNRGRGMDRPMPGRLRNVTISNIDATGASGIGSSITGQPEFPVENVLLDNIRIVSSGGGTAEQVRRQIPEYPDAYPEYNMFVPQGWRASPGEARPAHLPAYGLYARHVAGITLRNVHFTATRPDARPALAVADASELRVSDLSAVGPSPISPVLWLTDVAGALIESCRAQHGTKTFLRVDGARSSEIQVIDNDLIRAGNLIEKGKDVPAGVVRRSGGRRKK